MTLTVLATLGQSHHLPASDVVLAVELVLVAAEQGHRHVGGLNVDKVLAITICGTGDLSDCKNCRENAQLQVIGMKSLGALLHTRFKSISWIARSNSITSLDRL